MGDREVPVAWTDECFDDVSEEEYPVAGPERIFVVRVQRNPAAPRLPPPRPQRVRAPMIHHLPIPSAVATQSIHVAEETRMHVQNLPTRASESATRDDFISAKDSGK